MYEGLQIRVLGECRLEVNGTILTRYAKVRQISELIDLLNIKVYVKYTVNVGVYKRDFNRALQEKLRLSQRLAIRMFNGRMWTAFLENIPPKIRAMCYRGAKADAVVINNYWKHKDQIELMISREELHLVPFMLWHEISPENLRKTWGREIYKKIYANKASRNLALAKHRAFLSHLVELVSLPTSILLKNCDPFWSRFFTNNFPGNWTKDIEIPERRLFEDTIRFGVSEHIACKWSLRRLREEHDRLVKEYQAKALGSPERFEGLPPYPTFEVGEYRFKLLDSPLAMNQEGLDMKHCVGTYAPYVVKGDYLTYSVITPSERLTLGLSIYKRPDNYIVVSQNQLFGKCNAKPIPDDALFKATGELITKLSSYYNKADEH